MADTAADLVFELAGEGYDTIQTGVSFVLPADKSRVYGAPNPALDGTISGIRNGMPNS